MGLNIESIGYQGDIMPNQDYAMAQYGMGARYFVLDADHCTVTAVSGGTREVDVSPGWCGGWGVVDHITAPRRVQLPAGDGWYLLVMRRTWQTTQESDLAVIDAGATAALPSRNTNPGVLDDQPLALVQITAGVVSAVRMVRVLGMGSGPYLADDELVRSYMEFDGVQLQIGTAQWMRRRGANGVGEWAVDAGPDATRALPSAIGAAVITTFEGWSVGAPLTTEAIRDGNRVDIHFEIRRSGPVLQVYSSGNFPDTAVGKVAESFRPFRHTLVEATYYGGPTATTCTTQPLIMVLRTDGVLDIWSGAPGAHMWPQYSTTRSLYGIPISIYGHVSFLRRS